LYVVIDFNYRYECTFYHSYIQVTYFIIYFSCHSYTALKLTGILFNIQATVPDLTEGQEYEFRVIATNSAGQSEPSEPSDTVIAKARYCKYFFNYYIL
jgi:hypothetical protein